MLFTLAFVASVNGQQKESTRLTFDQPVRLPTVTLPAGSYTFERQKDFGIPVVTVFDASGRQVSRNTTKSITRSGNGESIVLQSPAGATATIAAWYPGSGSAGYEFIYGQATPNADGEPAAEKPQPAGGEHAPTAIGHKP
jgi:hypothetical protein